MDSNKYFDRAEFNYDRQSVWVESQLSKQGIQKGTRFGGKEYILTIKLDYAKRLLTTTTLTISEISEQAFFADAKHFMRLFKQKNGLTPSQYREENSHTNLNSSLMDPSSPLPEQFGNDALKRLLHEIMNEPKKDS